MTEVEEERQQLTANHDDSFDSLEDQSLDEPGEQWSPIKVPTITATTTISTLSEDDEDENALSKPFDDLELIRMEQEQEELNNSLLAVTSHFAQVQFRLKQIISAPNDEKEILLKDLEQFAFMGIPDVRSVKNPENTTDREHTV